MYYTLKYIFDETIISIRKSGAMLPCALVIITTALTLLGFFIISDKFLKVIIKDIENNLEIVAFLEDGFNEKTVTNVVMPAVSGYPDVAGVRLVTKEMAREELKKDVPELNEVFSVIEENPLPASLRIKVKSADKLLEISERLKKENGLIINELTYGGEKVNAFLTSSKKFNDFMAAFLALFILASVAVTAATIKLTVYARRNDIEIMKLVGATDWYIKWPYIIEGTLIGLISALCATILILFLKNGALFEIARGLQFLNAVKSEVSTFEICWKLVIAGILQGIIGAMWSTASALAERD